MRGFLLHELLLLLPQLLLVVPHLLLPLLELQLLLVDLLELRRDPPAGLLGLLGTLPPLGLGPLLVLYLDAL